MLLGELTRGDTLRLTAPLGSEGDPPDEKPRLNGVLPLESCDPPLRGESERAGDEPRLGVEPREKPRESELPLVGPWEIDPRENEEPPPPKLRDIEEPPGEPPRENELPPPRENELPPPREIELPPPPENELPPPRENPPPPPPLRMDGPPPPPRPPPPPPPPPPPLPR